MNSYFPTVGLKLSNTLPPPTCCRYGKTCTDKGETDSRRITDAYVSKSSVADKIKALKTVMFHSELERITITTQHPM